MKSQMQNVLCNAGMSMFASRYELDSYRNGHHAALTKAAEIASVADKNIAALLSHVEAQEARIVELEARVEELDEKLLFAEQEIGLRNSEES